MGGSPDQPGILLIQLSEKAQSHFPGYNRVLPGTPGSQEARAE